MAPRALLTWLPLILTTKPGGWDGYYYHFTGKEMKAQTGSVTFPGPHSVWQPEDSGLSF